MINVWATGVVDQNIYASNEDRKNKTNNFLKLSNTPNPFNPITTVSFNNPIKNAQLSIYTIDGQQIITIPNIKSDQYIWNANKHPSGIYIFKLTVGKTVQTIKGMLVK